MTCLLVSFCLQLIYTHRKKLTNISTCFSTNMYKVLLFFLQKTAASMHLAANMELSRSTKSACSIYAWFCMSMLEQIDILAGLLLSEVIAKGDGQLWFCCCRRVETGVSSSKDNTNYSGATTQCKQLHAQCISGDTFAAPLCAGAGLSCSKTRLDGQKTVGHSYTEEQILSVSTDQAHRRAGPGHTHQEHSAVATFVSGLGVEDWENVL